MAAQKIRQSRKNPLLAPGVHRFGRSKMYHKRGMKVKRTLKAQEKYVVRRKPTIEKPVGGADNGKRRFVQIKKSKRYHPTMIGIVRKTVNRPAVNRRIKLRGSLKPGTVLILVAGRHAGKRVVLLKQLTSGLLLVTGPFKLNGVPLRRVNQQYVIATSTRLDISSVDVPVSVNDDYFRRDRRLAREQRKKQEGEIFVSVKEGYKLSDIRKKDQDVVDKQILNAVKNNSAEKKLLLKYLAAPFSLKSGQYPHKMKF